MVYLGAFFGDTEDSDVIESRGSPDSPARRLRLAQLKVKAQRNHAAVMATACSDCGARRDEHGKGKAHYGQCDRTGCPGYRDGDGRRRHSGRMY